MAAASHHNPDSSLEGLTPSPKVHLTEWHPWRDKSTTRFRAPPLPTKATLRPEMDVIVLRSLVAHSS